MSCVKDNILAIDLEDSRNNGYTVSAIIVVEDEEVCAKLTVQLSVFSLPKLASSRLSLER